MKKAHQSVCAFLVGWFPALDRAKHQLIAARCLADWP